MSMRHMSVMARRRGPLDSRVRGNDTVGNLGQKKDPDRAPRPGQFVREKLCKINHEGDGVVPGFATSLGFERNGAITSFNSGRGFAALIKPSSNLNLV